MRFVAESVIATTPERLFAFHELPDAIEKLTPAWAVATILERASSLATGARAVVALRVLPLVRVRMEVVHTRYEPPRLFEDRQVRGPFRSWRHVHECLPDPGGARLLDTIDFELPMAEWLVARKLRRLFAYRHAVTRAWCEDRA